MTTLRVIGRFAGAVVLVAALAGCGGDGDDASTAADGTGSAVEDSAGNDDDPDDQGDEGDDAADQDDQADQGDAGDSGNGEDSGDDGGGSSGDSGSDGGGSDAAAPGVYKDYSADAVADASYDTTILFFHASWCPECRAFEEAIQDQGVPDGVQILKTDYDAEQDLKEKYGITIQSSFVKVDPDGDELATWFGYGEDKSVDAILEQLG